MSARKIALGDFGVKIDEYEVLDLYSLKSECGF